MTAPVWQPTSADVAPHLRHFLRDEHGGALPDFTANTRITKDGIDAAIISTAEDMHGLLGDLPDNLHAVATKTCAIGAAAEAVVDADERGKELYRELRELYESRLSRLIASQRRTNSGSRGSTAPSWSGPPPFTPDRQRF